ncbi:hypothetical protein ACHAPT_004294 [Fusarium lateritium]
MSNIMGQENDTRPEDSYELIPRPARSYASDHNGSPYASEATALRFQSGPPLNVPRDLLRQSGTLRARVTVDNCSPPSKEIKLPDITYHVGHVLVHFLVSGAYQCLKPQGDSPADRLVAEFTTALRVYDASQSLLLIPLRDLARREIARLGGKLSLPSAISVMERSHENFSGHPGIAAYIQYRMLSFGETAALETIGDVLAELETPNTLSKVLLKSMVLMKSSELVGRYERPSDHVTQASQSDSDDSSRDEIDQDRLSAAEEAMKKAEEAAKAEALRLAEEARVASERAELESLQTKKSTRGKTSKREKKRLDYLTEQETRRTQKETVVRTSDQEFPAVPQAAPFEKLKDEEAREDLELDELRMRKKKGRHALGKTKQRRLKLLEDKIARRTEARMVREEQTKAVEEGIERAQDEESFLFPSPETTGADDLEPNSPRSNSSESWTLDLPSPDEYDQHWPTLAARSSCPDAKTHLAPRSSGWLHCTECCEAIVRPAANGSRARGPYASDIVALQFSPRQTLRIPRQFLLKTPLIVRLALSETPGTLDLGSIKFDAGHVIVNFLVTGGYQCLQPWGITPTEKYASEFRTALRVYVAAESLGLTDLFNLAQDEVERVGDKLSFPQVVDNVHFLDPFHAHLPWVGEYVQSRMVSFWENTTVEQASEMVSDVLGPSNLHKILIGGLLKMKASESTIGKDQANQTTAGATGTSWSRMFQEAEATWEGTAKPVREADDLTQHNMAQQVPALTCKRELYEVEFEASYEDNKMRQLISEKENSRLVLSKEVQELLNRLIRESGRRAEVLAAQEAADQVENKHERAHLHFHLAVNQRELSLIEFVNVC